MVIETIGVSIYLLFFRYPICKKRSTTTASVAAESGGTSRGERSSKSKPKSSKRRVGSSDDTYSGERRAEGGGDTSIASDQSFQSTCKKNKQRRKKHDIAAKGQQRRDPGPNAVILQSQSSSLSNRSQSASVSNPLSSAESISLDLSNRGEKKTQSTWCTDKVAYVPGRITSSSEVVNRGTGMKGRVEGSQEYTEVRTIVMHLNQKLISAASVSGEISQLRFLEWILAEHKDPSWPIVLFIHSPGGLVDLGLRMAHALKQKREDKFTIIGIILHECSSIATTLLSQCSERYIDKRGFLMFHPAGYFDLLGVKRYQLKALDKLLLDDDTRIRQCLQDGYGPSMDIESLFGNDMDDQVYSEEGCLARKLVDGVIYSKEDRQKLLDRCRKPLKVT